MPWQFEQTFSQHNETGDFHSTGSKPVEFKAEIGTAADMDPPTVYISKEGSDDEHPLGHTKKQQARINNQNTESHI